jgi:hypothetical protein
MADLSKVDTEYSPIIWDGKRGKYGNSQRSKQVLASDSYYQLHSDET